MNRAILTPGGDDPEPEDHNGHEPTPGSSIPLPRERYKAAVDAVIDGARYVARAQAEQASRVEAARVACLAVGFTDQSSGGPGWSADVVTQRILVTELAAALRLSESDARRLIDTAEGLAGPFAATRAALQNGEISYRHAERIVQHAATLPPECLTDYEIRLLPIARKVSPQRLTRHARAATEEAQPVTAITRHLAATAERRLTLDPAADGMAFLTHYLPAVEAVAIYNRVTTLARGLKSGGDPRTLTQLRVDTSADLMLNGETSIPGATRGVRAHVNVTVPALTLLQSDAPADANSASAMLEGYGPIDRITALRLTRDAPNFYRVLTDPATGIALNYGRTRYRPPADLDQLIRTVHSECTFPLDCAPSATADLDHTEPWEDGAETSFGNLAPLCSSHHKVKHHTAWRVAQDPGGSGSITWTSPAGYEYTVAPTPVVRPKPRFAGPANPPRQKE